MNKLEAKYYSCSKAFMVMLKFRISLLKYFFQKKKYPLFTFTSEHGGVLKTNEMQKKLKIGKFVKYNNRYYFSLTMPHWPSKAFDNMAANGGLNITAAGSHYKRQIDTAILGITSKCMYKCIHCYEHFNLNDSDTVPVKKWQDVIKVLQKNGVSVITFSGGEPMMRYNELIELLQTADHSLSDFHIHTSGYGVMPENASELKSAGLNAAGIGLDDVNPDRNDLFRGYKGAYEQAIKAIKCFQNAEIFTYVNFCPTKEIIHSGDIFKYLDMLKDLNVGIIRWLEPRPCGAYLDIDESTLLSKEDKEMLTNVYIRSNTSKEYENYPLISYEAFSESPGNMGCMMAGNSLLYIDSLGNVEPCVFLPVSFGNFLNEDFTVILDRMRKAVPKPLNITCPSVLLSHAIKSKKDIGIKLPVPYAELKKEFSELMSE
jgi:MoaA/NifB/PqqE/SkfB family radical SAM enzyme